MEAESMEAEQEAEQEAAGICIEIAYAMPGKQIILNLTVRPGTTAGEAIDQSDIKNEFSEMKIDPAGIGIFSRKVALDHVLREGDRIEIYRPLIADPKEVRRERAKKEAGKL